MRFTCDACNAQYMISDEKVGPNGVKVRCKKCGHIILVKRAAEAAAPEPQAPAEAPLAGDGLDAELGQAFDKVLGEAPPPAAEVPAGQAAAAEAPAPPPAEAAPAEAVRGEAASPAGLGGEWYVAVDDQQVGPLEAPGVKGKWESGEIGPDTLVWKPGLEDWKPLSQVPELQQFLAPIPRPPGRTRSAARPSPAPAAPAPAAPRDPDWKPSAGSALAALASEEMAAMKAPEPAKAALARPAARSSLVDAMNLPEGGVDPTGAIPLPIKGLEKSGEVRLERKSSVARTTAELRIKRSTTRTIMGVAVVMLLLLAAGVGGVFWYFQEKIGQAPPTPQAQRTFAPPIPAPSPPQAQAAAPPAAAPQAAPPAAAPTEAASPAAAATPPPAHAAAPRKRSAPAPAAEKPATRKVAQAEPTPAPAPAPRKRAAADPFEGGGSADDEFQKLLNESPKRSVYVPPAPGGDVAEKVSTGQIQEAVAGKMGALRECLAKQQATEPDAHGEVTVSWEIEPDGRPARISTGTAQSQTFAQCLVAVVRSIRFPKSQQGNRGEDKVRFPFRY